MNPLVSVVVAVKNGERYLSTALESIMNQHYEPKQIIVVEGRSSDLTAEIARTFPVCLVTQEGTGIADAYNFGIQHCFGEFVAFLSHDDIWAPNKLSAQISYMLQNPELQYTLTRGKYFLQDGCSVPAKFKAHLFQGDHVMYGVESLIVRKSLFEQVGRFNTEFSIGEDLDWFSRTKDQSIPMGIVPEILLFKRVHDTSATITEPNINNIFLQVIRHSVRRKRQV
jgi:glycosyltransferase involved in cell wall biosynthesis